MSNSEAAVQAENITPPTASATPGVGVSCFSCSTSADTVDLYQADDKPYLGYFDRYISLMADGGDIYILFDDDSTNGIDQTVAHATSPASATAETVPFLLKDGVEKPYRLTLGMHRYLHKKASSGTPKLRITPSSPPRYSH